MLTLYVVRDYTGFIAVSEAFDSIQQAMDFMSEVRGVDVIDGMFLADGYWVDRVEVSNGA